jgi:hypothetical protein
MPQKTPDHQRLAGNPARWPSWPRGTACKVYMGHGWASGTWNGVEGHTAAIWLGKEQRTVHCHDARNVRRA